MRLSVLALGLVSFGAGVYWLLFPKRFQDAALGAMGPTSAAGDGWWRRAVQSRAYLWYVRVVGFAMVLGGIAMASLAALMRFD